MAVRETYISRILSALSDGVAKVDEKIKEVISIWICIDARKNEDSIIEYQLRPEVKFGENIHPEEINLLKGILIKIRGRNVGICNCRPFSRRKKNYLKNECGVEMTKELERKMEAMGESIGRVILQGMLEDAWDKGVEQERRNTEKEREHAIVAFISFGIPKEKILEKGYTEEEYTKVKKKLLS